MNRLMFTTWEKQWSWNWSQQCVRW